MIRSRIFRLRSFWLGLMGLLFLVWAWRDSMDFRSGLSFNYAATSVGSCLEFLGQGSGCLEVRWSPLDRSSPATASFGDIRPIRNHYSMWVAFPAPGILTRDDSVPGGRAGWRYFSTPRISSSLILPHWLLGLLYLPLWAGVVAWRWRAAGKREAGWNPQAKGEAP